MPPKTSPQSPASSRQSSQDPIAALKTAGFTTVRRSPSHRTGQVDIRASGLKLKKGGPRPFDAAKEAIAGAEYRAIRAVPTLSGVLIVIEGVPQGKKPAAREQ